MATLKDLLPAPKTSASTFYDHSSDPWFKERYGGESAQAAAAARPAAAARLMPPYGKRAGFVPRRPEDFGDGGAFPEIHVAQYPLGMGRRDDKGGSRILALTVDAHGSVAFDAVVKQGENAGKIVYSKHSDLVPKIATADSQAMSDDDEEQKQIEETTERTKAALEKVVSVRLSAAQPKNVPAHDSESKFIKYKPSQQSAAFNSGAKERIIRMSEVAVDPLEPPKFKHKRVPRASGSPPVPVMHSPPRPVTVKDQQDWKIPPCISNWKNPKGYTIPLDKRLAADGRGLQEVQINDNFAKLSEALYVAEQKAREAVQMRSKVQRELMLKEKERKEQELRALAQRARMERTGAPPAPSGVPAGGGRGAVEGLRLSMKIWIWSDHVNRVSSAGSLEKRGKHGLSVIKFVRSAGARGRGRGGWKPRMLQWARRVRSRETGIVISARRLLLVWQALVLQKLVRSCMTSGCSTRTREWTLALPQMISTTSTLRVSSQRSPLCPRYTGLRKKDGDSDVYGDADEQLEKVMKTERFKPDKGFTGASERTGKRDRPVEFDKQEENDPFGLDQFLTEVKKGKKAVEKIGGGGSMKASGGSSMRDDYDGGSGRSRINFERGR
jgi:SNW domain-containing protein 1